MSDDAALTLLQESEESWSRGLEETHRRYQMANSRYRALLERGSAGRICDQEDQLAIARDAESEALAEYTRLLKIEAQRDERTRSQAGVEEIEA